MHEFTIANSSAILLALIFTFLLLGLVKFCHYQFSHDKINKLTLRPLLLAIINLLILAFRLVIFQVFEFRDLPRSVIISMDRIAKFSTMVLGMAINYEKEVLNMFMIF